MMAVVISKRITIPYSQGGSGGSGGGGSIEIEPTFKKCHIGYQTVITSDNTIASSQAAGFPASNLVNPLTAHRWKPTSLPATVSISLAIGDTLQYMAIASHTLATTECIIEFQYSLNGGSSWTTLASNAPGNNKPIMAIFDELAKDWRIRLSRSASSTETAMPSIGVLMLGRALVMQRGIYQGHTPITMGRKTKRITNKTEGGQYAGNSIITEGVATSFEWKNIEAKWLRDNFEPFIVFARSRPFFIAWRPGEFPDEVGFCWTDDDIRPVNSGPRDLMSISMTVNGYSDE